MSKKIIKSWINGAVQEIEVEDIVTAEIEISVEDRLNELEDKPVITSGNFLVGNGTEDYVEMTPSEALRHIDGASISTLTTAEYDALVEAEQTNANVLYMLTDADEEEYALKSDLDDYAKTSDLFSKSYNDLIDKPDIPSVAGLASESYVDTKVAGIVNSAPETLDTLNELSKALGDDPNFATTIAQQIGELSTTVGGKANTGDIPINVSELTNDKGYITAVEVINGETYSVESISFEISTDGTVLNIITTISSTS